MNKFIKIYNKYINHCREISEITFYETQEMFKRNLDIFLIDVRSEQEYQEYHLNNSINIPLYNLQDNVEKIVKSKEDIIIVYCQSGIRSKKAVKRLKCLGYNNIYNMKGRIKFNLMSKRHCKNIVNMI